MALSPFYWSLCVLEGNLKHIHVKTHTEKRHQSNSVLFMFQLEATAVHWACRGGSLPALQLLLDQGAKFTYRDKVGTHTLGRQHVQLMEIPYFGTIRWWY